MTVQNASSIRILETTRFIHRCSHSTISRPIFLQKKIRSDTYDLPRIPIFDDSPRNCGRWAWNFCSAIRTFRLALSAVKIEFFKLAIFFCHFFFLFSSAHGTAVLYRSYSLFPVPVSLDLIFHSFTASLPRYLTAPVYSLLRVFIPLRSSLLFYFSRAIFPQKPLGLRMPSYSTEPDKIAIHSQLYDRSIKTSNNTRYRDTTI